MEQTASEAAGRHKEAEDLARGMTGGPLAERQNESYAIPFAVSNVGRSGARDVTVRFEIVSRTDGAVVEDLTITIDVLPVRGVEEGLLLISQDPETHTVTGRAQAYFLA